MRVSLSLKETGANMMAAAASMCGPYTREGIWGILTREDQSGSCGSLLTILTTPEITAFTFDGPSFPCHSSNPTSFLMCIITMTSVYARPTTDHSECSLQTTGYFLWLMAAKPSKYVA